MPLDATSESQAKALTSGNFGDGSRQLVARQPSHRLSPQRARQSDGALRRRRRRGHRQERARSSTGARRESRSAVRARWPVARLSSAPTSRTRSTCTPCATRAGGTPVRLSDSMPAGLEQVRPRRADAPCRSRAASTRRRCRLRLMLPKNLDRVDETSGHRVDSRLGVGSELPRLASRRLPDVLLGHAVPRAAGLHRAHARLPRQLGLQPRLGHRRAHGSRRERHGRRGGRRGLSEDTRPTSIPIASACGVSATAGS